jgi:galactokinase
LFEQVWGASPEAFSHAGGRVNLIGEHTDYHQGLVLPAAIDLRTWALGRRRADLRLRICSLDVHDTVEASIDALAPTDEAGWQSYVLGPLWAWRQRGLPLPGADILLRSTVPFGGGLSSSASVEVALLGLAGALSGRPAPPMEVARIGQQAENEFCHVPCGIMDQVASACGKAGCALLLDCETLQLTAVGIPASWALVVADSGVKHALGSSEYARRQRECAEGRRALSVTSLRRASLDMVTSRRGEVSDVVFRRMRHVVTENERVRAMVEALRSADAGAAHDLLAASHESLRRDYEVSCVELDELVDSASRVPGVIGARLTGAGFGGNTINVVQADRAHECALAIAQTHLERTGREVRVRVVEASDGLVAGTLSRRS